MANSLQYTGLTSKRATEILEARQEQVKQKESDRAALIPAYEQIVDDLKAEIAKMSDISTLLDGSYVEDEHLRFELTARRRYVSLCKSLMAKYTRTVKGVKNER